MPRRTMVVNGGKVGHLVVRGEYVELELTYGGEFKATYGERTFRSPTVEGLRAALLSATRKPKITIAIPATYVGMSGPEPVTVYGIHASSGEIQYQKEDGSKHTSTSWMSREDWLEPLEAWERDGLSELMEAEKRAADAVMEFRKAHAIDIRQVIHEAVVSAEEKKP